MEWNAVTQSQQMRPEEAPFDEPVEEPPENPVPYADPYPAERPGRPLDPKPPRAPPEVPQNEIRWAGVRLGDRDLVGPVARERMDRLASIPIWPDFAPDLQRAPARLRREALAGHP